MPTVTPEGDWVPEASDLAALGTAGRVFVERLLVGYSFKLHEAALVVELGHMADRLSTIRATGAVDVREEVLVSKHFAALLAQLKLEGA